MAHKTLVVGTAYDVKGGKSLVGGTGYSIQRGRTLIGGTGYGINFTVPISSISLNYASSVYVGSRIYPTVTINPSNYTAYKSRVFEITSGSSYASIDSSGGLVGKAAGTVIVRVTIVDALGNTFTATDTITVKINGYTVQLVWTDRTGDAYTYVSINGTDYKTAATVTVTPNTVITLYASERTTSSYDYWSYGYIYDSAGTQLASYGDHNSPYSYTVTQNIKVEIYSHREEL